MDDNPVATWVQQYPWTYFITITPRNARRDAIAFNRDVWRKSRMMGADRAFLACECFKFSHDLHCHGLIHFKPGNVVWTPTQMWTWYRTRHFSTIDEHLSVPGFGRCRVEQIRSSDQVSSYCAKYVTKWSDGDNYEYAGDWGVDKRLSTV